MKATTTVVEGKPAEEIVQRAGSPDIDMIAMITRRESALAPGILGSVTHAVLRSTTVPLLTIDPHGTHRPFGEQGTPGVIVVPLDGSHLSEGAVPVALYLAKATDAEVLFVWVSPTSYFYRAELGIDYLFPFAERARGEGIEAHTDVAVGSAARGIVEAVKKQPRPLVVMSTHGLSAFRRWIVGSVTDKVIRSSEHPVLVIPPQRQQLP